MSDTRRDKMIFIAAKTIAVTIQPLLRLMPAISMKMPPRRKKMVGIAKEFDGDETQNDR